MSKILGIDMGTKRIGLALSNIERTFAFPLSVLEVKNISETLQSVAFQIAAIATENAAKEVVIGESKNFAGKENPIMYHVHLLKSLLEKESLTVMLEPEFLTSEQAQRHQGKNDLLDASAACIILQSYLDRIQDKK